MNAKEKSKLANITIKPTIKNNEVIMKLNYVRSLQASAKNIPVLIAFVLLCHLSLLLGTTTKTQTGRAAIIEVTTLITTTINKNNKQRQRQQQRDQHISVTARLDKIYNIWESI